MLFLDFQLTYAPKAWAEERASWRMVIYLNLVRSINTILDLLTAGLSTRSSPEPVRRTSRHDTTDHLLADGENYSSDSDSDDSHILCFNEKHRLLKLRLAPLRTLQRDLERRIGLDVSSEDYFSDFPYPEAPIVADHDLTPDSIHLHLPTVNSLHLAAQVHHRQQEFFVRSSQLARKHAARESMSKKVLDMQDRDAMEIIAGCAEDMQAIWEDPVVREMLRRRGVMMEASAGL